METLTAPQRGFFSSSVPPAHGKRWWAWAVALGAVVLLVLIGWAAGGHRPPRAAATAGIAPAPPAAAGGLPTLGRESAASGLGAAGSRAAVGPGAAVGSGALGSGPAGSAVGTRPVGAPGALSAAAPATSGAAGPATAADGALGRVVKSGAIALVVRPGRVSPTLTAVQAAARAEGGYVADSSSDEYGGTPSGQVTIRVPVDRFESLVGRIRALDAKVRTATTTGRDVTAQYTDMESQLRTLRATRDRFLVILGQARTISEILTVQQRVDDVSGQIDRIEGDRRLLAAQSELSTLTVSVTLASDPVVAVPAPAQSGLAQAFADARDGFVNGLEAIIAHSGGVGLVLLCVVVLALLASRGLRVARRLL